ncbi:hypothetical protein SCT_0466 [Sulfuricella sp. T08]|nr:hypothetical protein SCT_0466 [Sulfuricella sp. T08]
MAFDPANGGDLGVAFCDGGLGVASCSSYTVTPSINGGQLYTGGQTVVEINHNVYISSTQNKGMFPAGTYDVLAIDGWAPGSTSFVPGSTIGTSGAPNNAVDFDVTFFGKLFTSDITTATQMPGTVEPANVVLALVHIGKWENGVNTGNAYQVGQINGSSNNFAVTSAVPVPAAAWLLGSGLLGLIGVARRKVA